MVDAVTGTLLSSFNKTSGPMLGWETAIECNDASSGSACTGTVSEQTWNNSTIVLESADAMFVQTLGSGTGLTHTDMVTADEGVTWTITKIVIPAVLADGTAASASGVASSSDEVAIATEIAEPACSFDISRGRPNYGSLLRSFESAIH